MVQKLYEYKKKLGHTPHGRGQEETLIIDGERAFVGLHIKRDEFPGLFGGYLFTQDMEHPRENWQYLGVWGKDKVRAFKRVMKERGAEFEVCKIDGACRFIKMTRP